MLLPHQIFWRVGENIAICNKKYCTGPLKSCSSELFRVLLCIVLIRRLSSDMFRNHKWLVIITNLRFSVKLTKS